MVDTERLSLDAGHAEISAKTLVVKVESWGSEKRQELSLDAISSIRWEKTSSMVVLVLAGWATVAFIASIASVSFDPSPTGFIAAGVVGLVAAGFWLGHLWTRKGTLVVSVPNDKAKISSKDTGAMKDFAKALTDHAMGLPDRAARVQTASERS